MADSEMSDDFVANLLKEDAKNASSNYSLQGIGAYLPKRSTTQAPKPNTRFLRNILRETDSHNQALLAKEAEESRARLRALKREQERKERRERHERKARDRHRSRHYDEDGDVHRAKRVRVDLISQDRNRLSPPRESKRHVSRRDESSDYERSRERRSRRRHEDSDEEDNRSEKRHHRRHKGQDEGQEDSSRKRERDDSPRRHRRKREADYTDERAGRKHRRSSPGESRASRGRSSSNRRSNYRKRRRDSSESWGEKSPAKQRLSPSERDMSSSKSKFNRFKRSSSTGADSDPLEDIVGPLPPPPPPKVKVRGRGAISSSAMDSRFSSGYDPTADVSLDLDEQDDWGQALEALRDRAKYQQNQGDRLRAAGFTEEEVKKWEKGGEKNEEDVKWAKKGEGREWDRGKVLDGAGTIQLEPEWGRLKGT